MAGAEARVPFVGLTGGIAAGKSEALEAFARLGAVTLSTDAVVHELLTTGEIRDKLIERFGDDVAPDGHVDRAAVAEVVFGDDEQRKWLEELLWPRVGQRVMEWRAALQRIQPPPRAAVVEVPLLFEAGMEDVFDTTIAVIADEPVRAERAGGRGHRSVDERTSRQLTQDEKAERADVVVRNEGSLEELEHELSTFLENMRP